MKKEPLEPPANALMRRCRNPVEHGLDIALPDFQGFSQLVVSRQHGMKGKEFGVLGKQFGVLGGRPAGKRSLCRGSSHRKLRSSQASQGASFGVLARLEVCQVF